MKLFRKLIAPRRAWYRARIAELEQRLAALQDALVPVPVGEPVQLWEVSDTAYIVYEGGVHQKCSNREWYGLCHTYSRIGSEDADDIIVQPVRLVRVRDMEGTS